MNKGAIVWCNFVLDDRQHQALVVAANPEACVSFCENYFGVSVTTGESPDPEEIIGDDKDPEWPRGSIAKHIAFRRNRGYKLPYILAVS
jgi:hypothetical protein